MPATPIPVSIGFAATALLVTPIMVPVLLEFVDVLEVEFEETSAKAGCCVEAIGSGLALVLAGFRTLIYESVYFL
jgi:hypothetical protein